MITWLSLVQDPVIGADMDKLLLLPEVATRMRQSPDTLRYWRHTGTGPPSGKLGRRVVYRESDVEAWIAAQFGDEHPSIPAA